LTTGATILSMWLVWTAMLATSYAWGLVWSGAGV
jgi:hypothetical protein